MPTTRTRAAAGLCLASALIITACATPRHEDTPPAPVTSEPRPFLQADLDRLAREFEYDSMCEAFRRNHDGGLPDEIEQILAHWADILALDEPVGEWLGPKIVEAGLDEHRDPLVRSIALTYQLHYDHGSGVTENEGKLFNTLDAMIDAGYPPLRTSMFAWSIRAVFSRLDREAAAGRAEQILVAEYYRACSLPNMTTAQRRHVYAKAAADLAVGAGTEFGDRFVEGLERTEGVDPWIAAMCRGILEWDRAYDARGSAFASETTDEQWAAFYRLSEPAVESLLAAYEIDPDCPEAPTSLVIAARSGRTPDGTDVWFWFERAVEIQPDYERAYNRLRASIVPKWGGSFDEMVELAERCARPELAGTRIPYQTINILKDFYDERRYWPERDYVWERPRLLLAVERASEMILEHDDSESTRKYMGTIGAYFAYQRGKINVAAQRLRDIDCDYDRNAMYMLRATDQHPPGLVLPFVDELLGPRARAADEREAAGDWDRAAAIWGQILGDTPGADRCLAVAVRDRVQTARWKAEFESGRWVELTFDDEMTGWRRLNGYWERVDDRTVRSSRGRSYYHLSPGFDLGRRYEFEARVVPVEPPTSTFRYGLAYAGNLRRTDTSRIHRSFTVHPGDGVLRCSWMWGHRDHAEPAEFGFDLPRTLRVVHDDDRVRCYVDGERVFDVDLINPGILGEPPESRVGVGGFGVGGGRAVEFSDIRVRKLPPIAPQIEF